MAAEAIALAEPVAGGGPARALLPSASPREFWVRLAGAALAWGRGLAVCLTAAALLEGTLAGFPVMMLLGFPVTVPVSALVIAWVGLRYAPQWGPLFAALMGLLADAAGAGQLGTTAWAYVPLPAGVALVHRHLRRDHPLSLILYATVQAAMQTGGRYLGLRVAGMSAAPVHSAVASICLSALLGLVAATLAAALWRFGTALRRQMGESR